MQHRYCKYLIIKSLENLLGFRRNAESCVVTKPTDDREPNVIEQTQMTTVLLLTKHLDETIQSENDDDGCNENGFAAIAWIARIITVAANWMLNDLANCDALYPTIDEFPQRLRGTKCKEKALINKFV